MENVCHWCISMYLKHKNIDVIYFRAASLDVEPVYTFRAHIGPVLCLAINATGEQCYSGGIDSTIKCWNIPNSNIDPYDSFGMWLFNYSRRDYEY